MEQLYVKNFASIEELVIELDEVNIFIGKQASGKSITAKLTYFFKSIFTELFELILEDHTKPEIEKLFIQRFTSYFPIFNWGAKPFVITYSVETEFISFQQVDKNKIKIFYSPFIKELYAKCRRLVKSIPVDKESEFSIETLAYNRVVSRTRSKYMTMLKREIGQTCGYRQIFIPAGRSFFANLQSAIFSFLSKNDATMDPLIVEFGSFYENIKERIATVERGGRHKDAFVGIDQMIETVLKGKYVRTQNKDYILHPDKRKVDLSFASSGQQETLPLALTLKALTFMVFPGRGATLYIEEPEAHLFPEAQKHIVELITAMRTLTGGALQFVITTHSPYILSAFNVAIEGHNAYQNADLKQRKKILQIVPEAQFLPFASVRSYSMDKGAIKSLMDSEYSVIDSDYLDSVSNAISDDYTRLIDISL